MILSKTILKIGLSLFCVVGFFTAISMSYTAGLLGSGNLPVNEPHVGLLRIEGVLMDALPVISKLEELQENKSLKGILIRVDSPGGAVGAAQEIYLAIERLREKDIPVIVSYGNVSASGGVYSTASATTIFSLPGTITGSVGVITQFPQFNQVLDKVGIKMHTIKSGKSKDMGSPFRAPTAHDKNVMNDVIEDSYEQFVEAIVKYRSVNKDSISSWADGRIFSGKVAQKIGLVDTLGGFQDAVAYAKEKAGLSQSSKLVEPFDEKPFLESMIGEPLSELKQNFSSYSRGVYYLWN